MAYCDQPSRHLRGAAHKYNPIQQIINCDEAILRGVEVPVADTFHFLKILASDSKPVPRSNGCENHFTKELFQKAQDAGMVLFPFPPHLTHILQPLDVGLFCVYKHWYQEILLREIADDATDFNKADFLFHLQEVRACTTKRSTIISSWQKTGIYPFDPGVVLARMINPLSSLSLEVAEESLPGYISRGSSSTYSSDSNSEMNEEDGVPQLHEVHHSNRHDQEIRLMSTPPPRINWIEMDTPELKLRQVRQYEEYVALRIECSITSGTPLTPSVTLRECHMSMKSCGKHIQPAGRSGGRGSSCVY
ncbi:hypothetical protein FOXB_03085 [Fusarium oxysporum f. sp. conglutinans Fo5176]|uniref:DDE-1 domain-containing protein n=1 Tax=Fusarium oxysporum (strain Fo5176) TaxID=660025 RepID=F9F9L0_FUSOF|nr:hypothetical protein FOXB_03085 [Fusarium oxysporum f. sp. conglutinans Fo5176]